MLHKNRRKNLAHIGESFLTEKWEIMGGFGMDSGVYIKNKEAAPMTRFLIEFIRDLSRHVAWQGLAIPT